MIELKCEDLPAGSAIEVKFFWRDLPDQPEQGHNHQIWRSIFTNC
jgi:hypothetical protein